MEYLTGEIFNKSIFESFKIKSVSEEELINLPLRSSLKEFCPIPGKQKYGTCYSYATAYSARTILYNTVKQEIENSEGNIFSPGFIQKIINPKSRRCKKKGGSTHYACRIMRDKGILKLSDYPNECSSQSLTQELRTKAIENRIKIKVVIKQGTINSSKTSYIKLSLIENKPVIITVYSKKTTMLKNTKKDHWKPNKNDLSKANNKNSHHAMCIVGYDNNKYGGAYEIMNSYGDSWMNKGFFWVKYDDMNPFITTAIEIFQKK